jgi:flavin reductase (DIM6/NTAB) family NADH-FMN oxidoreductase RutF
VIVSKEEMGCWDSKYRLKFTDSISGYRGVHLIGVKEKNGNTYLSLSHSIIHISSEPARIGFVIHPTAEKKIYNTLVETTYFTLNHVQKSFLEQAHFTSVSVHKDQSEFDACNLKPEYIKDFHAPFVGKSTIKLGLKLIDNIPLNESESHLLIGEVQFVDLKEDYLEEDGQIDLEKAHNVSVSGINQYSSVSKFSKLPDAKTSELPNFKQKKRPDNIVFDEESQSYNANILPYGTNVGAPSITSNNLSTWKDRGIRSYNQVLKSKIESLKEEYAIIVEEYNTNDLLYKAKYEFEPIIGEVYHLYEKENRAENFLSLISPKTWNRKHIASFKLNSEKVWIKIEN